MASRTDERDGDRSGAAPDEREPTARTGGASSRPPGPEEKRGSVATSNGADRDQRSRPVLAALRSRRFWLTVLATAVLNWFLAPILFPESQDRVVIPYTTFKQQVEAGNVAEVTGRGDTVQGQFKTPIPEPS